MKVIFKYGVVISGIIVMSAASLAEQSNEDEIRTLLINKLNNVYLTLPNQDPTKLSLTLRIADLLSERARAESNIELSKGCTKCVAGVNDRKKALLMYKEALPKVSPENAGRVLTQIGHLYELTGNENGAIQTYKKMISENSDPAAVAEAQLSLAEMYFKRNNFSEARQYYDQVFKSAARVSKGLAAYRMAWCDFRLGRVQAAAQMMQKILSDPELLTRSSQTNVTSIDTQFHEEVTHDFVTFLAQNNVNENAAQLVYDLSPIATKLNHVFDLAVELERLGLRGNSISVWQFLQEKETRPLQRLEGYVRLAQLQMEQKNITQAFEDYNRGLAMWPQICEVPQESCKELGIRIKNFAIDAHKMEQKSPSTSIFDIYEAYLKVFSNEVDMALQAAVIAKHLKNWPASFQYFGLAAQSYMQEKNSKKLEDVLLNQIEVAELSKDSALVNEALDLYLDSSITKSADLKVRYQKAKIEYDKGDYSTAVNLFRAVAFTPGHVSLDLKEKAADLSLDALVLLKDEKRLEAWARDYAKLLPGRSHDFLAIASRSVLNKAVEIAKSSPESALAELKKVDRSVLNLTEQVDVVKNIIILAEKIHRFDEARRATNDLLAIQNLKAEDRTFALEHKIYLAELTLDFQTAYSAAKEMSGDKNDAYWLKMALLAELAGQPADAYYVKFMNETKDQDRAEAIAVKIISASPNPLREIELYKNRFATKPERLAELYLEAYAKAPNSSIISIVEKNKNLKGTFGHKTLLRQNLLNDYKAVQAKITSHQIDASSQKKLSNTIKARGKLLDDVDKVASRAVALEDFSSQILALDLLGKESKRFYEEIMSLPLPEGLTPEEQGQYLQMLSQQASPHQVRSQDLAIKVSEFWQNKAATDAIQKIYPQQVLAVQNLLKPEVELLAHIAPASGGITWPELGHKSEAPKLDPKVDFKVIEQARSNLREDPLNKTKVEKLLSLEKGFGGSAMVSYLESRLENLKTKEK
ncbi:MAG: tetratricopeptide repeat protein [Bdellovibrionales bacterium]|nr:tetratricopeptide repeat protein [Bdellovibrionales bacterium]